MKQNQKQKNNRKKLYFERNNKIKIISMNTLKGITDIKAYFKENKTPIYFISATNFNLLGIDEWISNFKFISHIDCFNYKYS